MPKVISCRTWVPGCLRPCAAGRVGQVVAQLVKDRLGLKYHWALPDYLQRSARHLASKTDVEQAYALGKAAVELAVAGRNAVMPGIVRPPMPPIAGKSALLIWPMWPTSSARCRASSSVRMVSRLLTSAVPIWRH